MFPTATPTKIAAEERVFLVVPPTFPDTSERPSTNAALDDPVKSGRQHVYRYRRGGDKTTVANESGSGAVGECDQGESEDSNAGDSRHEVGSNVHVVGQVVDVD